MDDSFGVLEQKVRKAAETVRRLREESKTLQDELRRAQTRLKETERELDGAGRPSAQEAGRLADLSREVTALRDEREEIRSRIAKLVEVLDGLD